MILLMLEKLKQSFVFGLIIIKVNFDLFERKINVPQKRFYSHYVQNCRRGINDWNVTLFEKCETHKQLKERETFWQYKLKTFYPLGLNEKNNIYFNHTQNIRF